ncbi:MAG: class I tRNA ligase family protein, partial [bacterium]
FMNVKCPKCGGEAQRDPDTMDTFVCSSWYYLRYIDPNNDELIFDPDEENKWLPIDLYIGGITHATGHLIYFRFFHKFLYDLGIVKTIEPATQMFNHGMVKDENGEVMSKSKGNVTSPMAVMAEHGVDISRMAMFFKAPSEKEVDWSDAAIVGSEKFVMNKLVPIIDYCRNTKPDLKYYFKSAELSSYEKSLYIKLNQTIKRVTDDFPRLQFNTSIAALMELIREYEPEKVKNDQLNDYIILKIIQFMAPMIPHLAEEMWQKAGFKESVFRSEWPIFDPDAVIGDTIEIAVQINGKLRDTITIAAESNQEQVEKIAFESEKIQNYTKDMNIVKIIFVKGRILNIVVK